MDMDIHAPPARLRLTCHAYAAPDAYAGRRRPRSAAYPRTPPPPPRGCPLLSVKGVLVGSGVLQTAPPRRPRERHVQAVLNPPHALPRGWRRCLGPSWRCLPPSAPRRHLLRQTNVTHLTKQTEPRLVLLRSQVKSCTRLACVACGAASGIERTARARPPKVRRSRALAGLPCGACAPCALRAAFRRLLTGWSWKQEGGAWDRGLMSSWPKSMAVAREWRGDWVFCVSRGARPDIRFVRKTI